MNGKKDMPQTPPEKANRLLDRVVQLYAKTFDDVSEGRTYFERRGIADLGLLGRHRIGYADGRLKDLLPKNGQLKEELRDLGILLEDPSTGSGQVARERFDGCVVFPICDAEGTLTTMCGKSVGDDSAGYVCLAAHPTGLWNAVALKTYPELLLATSIIDALSVMMAGHANVIGIQEAGGMADHDAAMLRTYGVQRVMLLTAGNEARGKAIVSLRARLRAHGVAVTLRAFPAGYDANSYLIEHGAERLAEFLTAETASSGIMDPGPVAMDSPPSACLSVTYGARRYEVRGLEKGPRKLRATIRVEYAGKLHVDTLDFYSARSRRLLAQDLCRVFEQMPEVIEAELDKLLRHCEKLPESGQNPEFNIQNPVERIPAAERKEAESFGRNVALFAAILTDYEACGLVGEKANKLLCYLAMTSRKMDNPLSVLILSSSGAGKTALQDTALTFCPPEDLVKLTSLTGKALFYKEQLSLRHKVLSLEEGAGAEEASYAIRNLITAHELVIESAIKDTGSGKITTMTNKVEGPTAVFLTTTDPDTDPETRSRFFVTSIDESREQTRAILSFQRRRHTLGGQSDKTVTDAVLRKHRNFQRLLRPLTVVNPYAERLSYGDDRLEGRRDQPKYLNLIKTVAFLRQMQKTVMTAPSGAEYLEANLDDIRLANDLAAEILGKSMAELSAPARELLLQAETFVEAQLSVGDGVDGCDEAKRHDQRRAGVRFTRREIREFTGWANTRVHRYLKELVDFEYVLVESGRNGTSYRYRLAWDGRGMDGKRFVPGLRDVEGLGIEVSV